MDMSWRSVTTPKIEFYLNDSKGTKLFEELVGDKREYVYEICEIVCKILYKDPNEVPVFEKLTFIIDDFDGVAWKDGDSPSITVAVSSRYLEDFNNKGGDIKEEVKGILIHEITHAYQHSKDMELFVIEGIADLTRYLAGYIDVKNRVLGGKFDSSYKITAFFFEYLNDKYIKQNGFLYELNQNANPKCNNRYGFEKFVESKCGEKVDLLWDDYQKSLKNSNIEVK